MLIETRTAQNPLENSRLAFESFLKGRGEFIPRAGRLVWSRKAKFGNSYHWGIEFVNPPADVIGRLRERIHAKIVRAVQFRNAQNIVGAVFFACAVIMAAFVLREQNLNYRNLQKSNELALSASDSQAQVTQTYMAINEQNKALLASLTQELESTKTSLAQSQAFLAQMQQENIALQEELQSLQIDIELGNQVVALREQNARLESELASLQAQLGVFDGRSINTVAEGKTLLAFYQDKVRGVKNRIKNLRIAMQEERDRALLIAGNQGVFVKGYYVPEGTPEPAAPPIDKRGINIDVSFF